MSLTKKVKDTLREQESERGSDKDFKRLSEFSAEMKRKGLLLKREYGIPPIDTIGKTMRQSAKRD